MVSGSIITNAEKMKEKHSKRKRIRVVNFSIGENVSVEVPEIDRDKSDPKRVPGVVVSVTGSVQPKYRVLTAHGAIKDVFTSSYLSSCPGIVKTGNPDQYITLREAARLHTVHKKEVTYCKCRSGCRNNKCTCKNKKAICLTRCHRGKTCKNGLADSQKTLESTFPSFGGKFVHGSIAVKFTNNCPIDNWLMLFKAFSLTFSDVYERAVESVSQKRSEIAASLGMARKGLY